MINRTLFHPALRKFNEAWIEPRVSSHNFGFPENERISWMGDVQLFCRPQDYQALLDAVPCATTEVGGYRRVGLAGGDLDLYRDQIRDWLRQFDDWGNPIAGIEPPRFEVITPTVPVTVVIGPSAAPTIQPAIEQQAPAPIQVAAATGVNAPAPAPVDSIWKRVLAWLRRWLGRYD